MSLLAASLTACLAISISGTGDSFLGKGTEISAAGGPSQDRAWVCIHTCWQPWSSLVYQAAYHQIDSRGHGMQQLCTFRLKALRLVLEWQ